VQRTVHIINNCMYSWQVEIALLPQEPLYRFGKVQTVRIEFLHCGFSIIDHDNRFDNLFAVAHPKTHAATLFRLKYDYMGLTIKRC
jgi:hypothetical protein